MGRQDKDREENVAPSTSEVPIVPPPSPGFTPESGSVASGHASLMKH